EPPTAAREDTCAWCFATAGEVGAFATRSDCGYNASKLPTYSKGASRAVQDVLSYIRRSLSSRYLAPAGEREYAERTEPRREYVRGRWRPARQGTSSVRELPIPADAQPGIGLRGSFPVDGPGRARGPAVTYGG